MDKRSFQNETAFQVVMHLARRMLAEKLITGKEYRDFVQEMIRRRPSRKRPWAMRRRGSSPAL